MTVSMTFPDAYESYCAAFDAPAPVRPAALGVRFVKRGEAPPAEAAPLSMAYTWCYALRQAAAGEVPLVTRDSIGCVMAAIALGLVDEDDPTPLPGWRQYSQNMGSAPAPLDYKEGRVFACAAAGRQEFALYGGDDPGRYEGVEAARRAFGGMARIQPACMDGLVAFGPQRELAHIVPNVVVLALTPSEAVRTLQAITFRTGERVRSSTLGVAGFCVDLTAMPYLTGAVNTSFLCLGARILARWEGDLAGIGMPFDTFVALAGSMGASRRGYPFARYAP